MDEIINPAGSNNKKHFGLRGVLTLVIFLLLVFNVVVGALVMRKNQGGVIPSDNETAELNSLSGSKEPAILSGRVKNEDPLFESCTEGGFWYGMKCGTDKCHGETGYKISWRQGGKFVSIEDNECLEEEGDKRPGFNFLFSSGEYDESLTPGGDADGEEVEIKVQMDEDVQLTDWYFRTSNSQGETYTFPGGTSEQSGFFLVAGPEQTFKLRVYRNGDYQWNYLVIMAVPRPASLEIPSE